MLTTCRNKHFKWWEALAVTAPEYKSFSEHFYPIQYLFHPNLQCQGSIVSSTWFVAISWAFWGQLVIIFSVFSFCHRQNVAFMSNWSWVIPKVTTLCKKKKKIKNQPRPPPAACRCWSVPQQWWDTRRRVLVSKVSLMLEKNRCLRESLSHPGSLGLCACKVDRQVLCT